MAPVNTADEQVPRFLRAPGLAPAPYAYGVVVPAGYRLVLLAGSCPLDAAGGVLHPGDYAGQARVALDNLETALAEAGATLGDVVQTRILVASADRGDLDTAWDVVADHFGDHEVPSTLIGVTVLGYPGQLVEIDATAAVPDFGLSARLLRRLARDFPAREQAAEAARLVSGASDTERVQAAVVLAGGGDLDALRRAVDLARLDWRDVLMGSGLEHGDWAVELERRLGP